MQSTSKCFIRIAKGIFEEITYEELERRREIIKDYEDKKFIYVHRMLMEVTEEEYARYYQEIERNRYARKVLEKLNVIAIEAMEEDEDFDDKTVIEDPRVNIEEDTIKMILYNAVEKALLTLSDEELKIIEEIFFREKTIRNCAEIIGISKSSMHRKKEEIIEKLKKLLKI